MKIIDYKILNCYEKKDKIKFFWGGGVDSHCRSQMNLL